MSFNIAPQEVGEVRRMSRSTRNDSVVSSRKDFVVGIIGDHSTAPEHQLEQWTPSIRLYLAFLTLAVITMMVALDGTSLSVALPVCILFPRGGSDLSSDPSHSRLFHRSSGAPPSKLSGPELPFSYAPPSSSQVSLASRTSSDENR